MSISRVDFTNAQQQFNKFGDPELPGAFFTEWFAISDYDLFHAQTMDEAMRLMEKYVTN